MKKLLLGIASFLGIKELIVRKVINKRSKNLYRSFIKQNDLVFDIGANIGNRTGLFLELGANVISVEPQKACIDILIKKFAGNSKVTLVPKGVSDNEGTIELYTSEESSVIATMSDRWKAEGRFSKNTTWNASQAVELTTLDELINKFGLPQFCKIDVEGFEKKVIGGLSKKIPVISFEFTKEFIDDAFECLAKLNKIAPNKLNYSLGESMILQDNDFIPHDECLVKLKNLKDELAWGDIYVKFDN